MKYDMEKEYKLAFTNELKVELEFGRVLQKWEERKN
jgi:hypothetical protein